MAATTDARPSGPATLLAFAALVTLAGGNAVAIRYTSCAACELDPFWGAAIRFFFATAIFTLIALRVGGARPGRHAFGGAVMYGVLQFGIGFGLVYWGLVRAPAGLGQVLLAGVPLFTLGLALVHRQEGFRWEGLVGAVVAVSGIAVVFSTGTDAGIPLTSMLALVGGAVCWAEALVVVKGSPAVHPAVLNAVGMGTGSVVLVGLTLAFGESQVVPRTAQTWGAQAYLVLAGSVGVFWLYALVLQGWTASAASYQMVLIPLVTVAVSAWLQDERITGEFAGGAVLVLIGVYIGALWRRPRHRNLTPSAAAVAPSGTPGRFTPGPRAGAGEGTD